MFNPLKLKTRLKVIVAIIIALLISFLFIKPKENNIPIVNQSYKLELTQQADNTLSLKNITVTNGYSPDYQTEIPGNYYLIEFKNKNKSLFTGKMVKKRIIISEQIHGEVKNEITENDLGDFTLLLPYYKDATELVITEDTGTEALNIDLASKNLEIPPKRNTCGDGICTDNENLLICYTDCKYLLPKWIPK